MMMLVPDYEMTPGQLARYEELEQIKDRAGVDSDSGGGVDGPLTVMEANWIYLAEGSPHAIVAAILRL